MGLITMHTVKQSIKDKWLFQLFNQNISPEFHVNNQILSSKEFRTEMQVNN